MLFGWQISFIYCFNFSLFLSIVLCFISDEWAYVFLIFVWTLFVEQAWFKWKYNALSRKTTIWSTTVATKVILKLIALYRFPVILNSLLVTNLFVDLLRSEETYLKHHILASILTWLLVEVRQTRSTHTIYTSDCTCKWAPYIRPIVSERPDLLLTVELSSQQIPHLWWTMK